jgi:hypothetical protein
MHHWMPFQQLSSRPHAKDKHGWAASITLQEIHGDMWSKWTREHGHDSKHEASSGRANNAWKGVDESVWAVQLVEHAGKKVTEEKWSCWKKTDPGRGTRPTRPVGPRRPASPTNSESFNCMLLRKLLVTCMPWKSFQARVCHAPEVRWRTCHFGWMES